MFRVSLLQLNSINHIKKVTMRSLGLCTKLFKENVEEEGSIKFTSSPASKYRASTTRQGYTSSARLWYEPYVIMASLTVFMVYFTILREENDIDHELGRSLYSRIEGLEEFQLKQALEYNQSHAKDTGAIITRLKDIEDEKDNTEER